MDQPNQLGVQPVGKLLFRLALPSIAAQLVNMLYNIVDRMYIGHMEGSGHLALTGVGLCFPIIMIITAFSSLIGMGGAPRASIKMGEGDYEGAQRILGNCFSMLIVFSVVLTTGFLIFQEPLLILFGASESTLPFASAYLKIYVAGTVFVQMALGLNPFISSQGFAAVSMLTVVIGAAVNILLDPIFIFALGMGVQGAALATIISQSISCIWILCFLFRSSAPRQYHNRLLQAALGQQTRLRIQRKYLKVRWGIIAPVLALGVSPFIMTSTESAVNIALNRSLQNYGGDLAVGAMTILSSLMQILNMPLQGMTQGAQPIVSFNYGAGNPDRVKKAFKLLLISCLTFATLFCAAVELFPQVFILIFNDKPELMEISIWTARVYMGGAFLMGGQIACQQTFIAVGQAKISLFLALLRKMVLLIPLIFILPNFFENKVFAVFLAEPVSDIIAACTTMTLFRFKFRKILAGCGRPSVPANVALEGNGGKA